MMPTTTVHQFPRKCWVGRSTESLLACLEELEQKPEVVATCDLYDVVDQLRDEVYVRRGYCPDGEGEHDPGWEREGYGDGPAHWACGNCGTVLPRPERTVD